MQVKHWVTENSCKCEVKTEDRPVVVVLLDCDTVGSSIVGILLITGPVNTNCGQYWSIVVTGHVTLRSLAVATAQVVSGAV